ncbi:unnamed protein product [Dovyalis caffra]|uniref:Ribosomal protein S3 n=1 Tax=Dovyalis caffra TaxID=77055 RepID=A0AAV1RNV8_9ROSI|nr:unnamed protein product [Dovyalis caffra]
MFLPCRINSVSTVQLLKTMLQPGVEELTNSYGHEKVIAKTETTQNLEDVKIVYPRKAAIDVKEFFKQEEALKRDKKKQLVKLKARAIVSKSILLARILTSNGKIQIAQGKGAIGTYANFLAIVQIRTDRLDVGKKFAKNGRNSHDRTLGLQIIARNCNRTSF